MPFIVTKEHVKGLLDPTAEGDWEKFIGAIDPNVHWIVVDPTFDEASLAGTYNVKTWKEVIGARLSAHAEGPVKMNVYELDVIGNKVIFESTGDVMLKSGKPYRNRWCWVLYFSEETGKIVTIREYMNSALTKALLSDG